MIHYPGRLNDVERRREDWKREKEGQRKAPKSGENFDLGGGSKFIGAECGRVGGKRLAGVKACSGEQGKLGKTTEIVLGLGEVEKSLGKLRGQEKGANLKSN